MGSREYDSYRARRQLSDAVVTLRQLQSELQRVGWYDYYNVVRDQVEELEHILRKVELDRARELEAAGPDDLVLFPIRPRRPSAPANPHDERPDDGERDRSADVDDDGVRPNGLGST